jgi:acetolactate synthase-1/2/3 large subunit
MHRVRDALAIIAKARRPMIVAGGGVVASDAQAELVELAERLGVPVATSLNAKAAMIDAHPLNVGVPGAYSRDCANRALAEADLVFFIGSHTGGQVTNNWMFPAVGIPVVQLDIDPEELGRNYPNTVSILGDAKVSLRRMIDAAPATAPEERTQWIKRVQQIVADWRAENAGARNSDAAPIRPERVCKEISDVLPPNGIVVSDTGHAGIWTARMIELKHAGQRYYRTAGSLGWGFPGALGVKCALPDRPVVCFTGDGGFYYHIAELETARRHNINAVIVVNNNSALNQEIPLVSGAMAKPPQKLKELWEFEPINFAKVAESFGCVGIRAETPAEFRDALTKALKMNRPVVIDAVSDVNAFARRAWQPAGVSSGQ